MGTKQVALNFREYFNTPVLGAVSLELDSLVAQLNTALRGIGTWSNQAFAATDYRGNGAMTWTVVAGQTTTNQWTQFGKTLILQLMTIGTTVGGTLNTQLILQIPGNLIIQNAAAGSYSYKDNGTFGQGIWEVATSGTTILFYKSDKSNWAASTNATDIRATVIAQVQ